MKPRIRLARVRKIRQANNVRERKEATADSMCGM